MVLNPLADASDMSASDSWEKYGRPLALRKISPMSGVWGPGGTRWVR